MTLIDRLLGRRQAPAVAQRHAARSFTAARMDRLTAGWLATTSSINQELRGDLDKLRSRARDLSKNNDYARKFKRMVSANLVGPAGFRYQARVMDGPNRSDELANNALESAFADWGRRGKCEITGRMSFADLCRALAGDAAIDGELLLRKIRGAAAGNAYGFALQHLDIDRLDTLYNVAPADGRNAVVMGIEIDAYRRPVAYHLFTSHPNDGISGGRARERVPASEIIHGFLVEYPEQVRGAPWMSAAILTLHHLGEFEQSALLAARKGADTLGFFVSPDGTPPPIGDTTGENDEPITVSVPGHYDTLPDGYDFKPYDSRYPDTMLEAFCKNYIRRAASGLSVAYNSLANDLEGVNFSSIRAGVLEERDQWMALQGWMIECLLEPIFDEWLGMALLNGAIVMPNGSPLPAAKRDKFAARSWQGRRWPWVDPLKDIEASLAAIRAGLQSPYNIANQMGLDLDEVMADLARANAAAGAAGLPSYTGEPPAMLATLEATVDDGSKALTMALARSLGEERKAGDVHVHNHNPVTLNQGEVRNEIHVPPPEAPVLHVVNEVNEREAAAPVIQFNPVTNVAAPEVTVEVDAIMPAETELRITGLPDRVTTTEIIRDGAGNIAESKQTERDA